MSFPRIGNINIEKIGGDPKNPSMVYYNFDIINGKTTDEGINSDPLAVFNETRDTPIIQDCSKYYFSITRFTMNGVGLDIPMFIPRIEIGQADPNKTIYYLAMEVMVNKDFGGGAVMNTFRSTRHIEYFPQNVVIKTPPQPLTTQDVSSPYYYVYTYEHWVHLVNTTLQQIYNDLNALYTPWAVANGAPPGSVLTTRVPKMKYDSTTKLFSIYYDAFGFGDSDRTSAGTTNDESFRMICNSNFYGLFDSFPNYYLGGDVASSNIDGRQIWAYELVVRNQLGTNIHRPVSPTVTAIADTPAYYVMRQDYISTGTLWSPVASIVFVSNLIPVLNEGTAQPITYGQNNISVPVSSSSAFQPIITDIALANDTADAYNGFVSYVPSAEYRLSSMSNSPSEVKNIDVQIYWKNRLDGQLYPLRMFNQSSISVKIMFRRRDYSS